MKMLSFYLTFEVPEDCEEVTQEAGEELLSVLEDTCARSLGGVLSLNDSSVHLEEL